MQMSTQEAADALNVSRRHLMRLLDRGDLPSHTVGAHRRDQIRRQALDVLAADAH